MNERLLQLTATPCSAEYLADVLRMPLDEVKQALARLEKKGLLRSKVLVTYQAVDVPTAAERKLEQRLALRLAYAANRKAVLDADRTRLQPH